jgi:cytochrome P450
MRRLDLKKLMGLPLLQSIYIEVLRLHVSINVTREVTQDMVLDGYLLKKGHMIQAPSMIAHFDEKIWGTDEHPASEFWAERHISYADHIDESGISKKERHFSLGGRGSSLAAYGE